MTALTKNSVALNRTLFLKDNLPVLRGLDSDSIDLIATDPPFNKGVPAFEGTTKAGQNVEFKDVWNWNDDVHVEWTNAIADEHPSLFNVILYANAAAGDDMGAFLCWMAVRMLEMHRVLKPTGSIYLHCDPTASHYLKAMMDAIFGRENFRNEIVWHHPKIGVASGKFTSNTDTIFYYTKGNEYTFNSQTTGEPNELFNRWKNKVVDNKLYYEQAKTIKDSPAASKIRVLRRRLGRELEDDDVVVDFSDPKNEKKIDNVWLYPFIRGNSKESTGYPTQKPLAMYKRMIAASSNPGDIVLDPFAGCATTCVAAEQLGRQWIGIDIREDSGGVIRERLEREVSESMEWDAIVRTPTEAPERTDDGEPAAPELVLESPKPNARRISVREARELLIVRDGLRCQGCGWEPNHADYLQVDHNKPRSLKGTDEMDNLALLCDPCNRKKSNKLTIHELRQARAADEDWVMDEEWWKEQRWKL